VTGPPAAGKTTYVAEHRKDGDIVVDYDALAVALGQTAPHSLTGGAAELAKPARDAAIDTVLAGIESDSWIIQTWLNPDRKAQYETAGAEIVTVDPGKDTVLEQATADERPDGTEAEIDRWYENGGSYEKKSDAPARVMKSFTAKADTSAGKGRFTALVSAFGVADTQHQVIEAGAFADSLKGFTPDQPLPLLWDHKWDDIWSHIGSASAKETDEGLQIDAQLDMNNPTAQQAYSLLTQGRVHEFSIGGYIDDKDITTDEQGLEHISIFDLTEVSMTLKGANPATKLIDVKSQSLKEGRVLASKHVEALRTTRASLAADITALDSVIAAVSPDPPGKSSGKSQDEASDSTEAFLMRKRRAFALIHLTRSQTAGKEEK
jgi:HK97 family phage prohead protease